MTKFKALLLALIGTLGLFFFAFMVHAVSPTQQGLGGTSTSTVFSQNSLIVQGVNSYAGLVPGSNGFVLQMVAGVPTYVATSTLGIVGSGTVTAVTGSGNIASSGGTTPNITFTGILPTSNGGTGTNTLASLTSGSSPNLTVTGGQNVLIGTSTQISLGTNVVTTLATGTSGTIFNGSIGSNTLTLNLPFASGVNTGQLLNTDWTTFNNKVSTTRNINTTAPITGGGDLSADRTIACPTCVVLSYASSSYFTLWNTQAGSNITITTSSNPTIAVVASPTFTNGTFTGTLGVTGTSTLATTTITKLIYTNASGTNESLSGTLNVTGTSTLATTTISQLSLGNGIASTFLAADPTGKIIATTSPSGGSGVTGGTNGKVAVFTSATTLGTGDLLDNLTVSGVNATSSTVNFNIQGTGALNPFNVASSSGASLLTVLANGNVGIGSSSPIAPMVVAIDASSTLGINKPVLLLGTNALSSSFGSSNGSYLGVNAPSSFTGQMIEMQVNNSRVLEVDSTGQLFAGNAITTGGAFVRGTGASLAIQTNNSNPGGTVLLGTGVAGNANVGIGTATPNTALQVVGTSAIDPFSISSTSGTSFLRVTQAGNVGIGTGTPQSSFVVIGSGASSTTPIATIGTSTNTSIFNILQNGNLSVGAASSPQGLGFSVHKDVSLFTNVANTTESTAGISALGILNVYKNGASVGDPLFCVSSSNATNQFCVKDQTATNFLYGIQAENLLLGSIDNSTISTNQTGNNYLRVWDTSSNTTLASTNNILLNPSITGNGGVGINTIATSTTLAVKGVANNTALLDIASSSGISVLRVTGAGNVGINTTTPGNALTVIGSISSSALTSGNCVQASTGGLLTTTGSACGGGSGNSAWTIGNALIFNATSTDSVLVGTSTPTTAAFFIQGSGTKDYLDIASSTGANVYQVVQSTQSILSVGTSSTASNLIVQGNTSFPTENLFTAASSTGATLVVIQATGKVGIGTSTPTFGLDLRGGNFRNSATGSDVTDVIARDDGGAGIFASGIGGSGFNFDGNGFKFAIGSSTRANINAGIYSGTDILTILSTGRVGIGSTTPNYGFVANGTVAMPNLTPSSGLQTGVVCVGAGGQLINDSVACLASAARYKQNINPLSPGLNEIMKLTPVSYYFKPDFNGTLQKNPNYNGLQYGLIADDVQKIDPNLVIVTTATTTFEGKQYPPGTVQGLQSSNTWAGLFVKAIQDLEKQITDIIFRQNAEDAKIQVMQAQLDKQQKQINLLLKFNAK